MEGKVSAREIALHLRDLLLEDDEGEGQKNIFLREFMEAFREAVMESGDLRSRVEKSHDEGLGISALQDLLIRKEFADYLRGPPGPPGPKGRPGTCCDCKCGGAKREKRIKGTRGTVSPEKQERQRKLEKERLDKNLEDIRKALREKYPEIRFRSERHDSDQGTSE